jgi:hypothetical protein
MFIFFWSVKKYLVCFLLFVSINSHAQIYSKKGEMKFEVVQYTSKHDSVIDTLRLILHGDLWKFYSRKESRLITSENNWSIDWVYSSTDKKNTGIIENDSLVFMHPPRSNQYAILEYCPFPQIQFPLYIGKSWNFDLEVGGVWLKAIKRNVEGQTMVTSSYTVIGKISWYCPFLKKDIDCYEIKAIGNTKFGNTSLQAYFSEVYGFVYLDYETLNNDKFIFTLQSVILADSLLQYKIWF